MDKKEYKTEQLISNLVKVCDDKEIIHLEYKKEVVSSTKLGYSNTCNQVTVTIKYR
ncbi:MAG: hypothetical protein ACOC1K_05530 [Nanoarchaeota archaeon]